MAINAYTKEQKDSGEVISEEAMLPATSYIKSSMILYTYGSSVASPRLGCASLDARPLMMKKSMISLQ